MLHLASKVIIIQEYTTVVVIHKINSETVTFNIQHHFRVSNPLDMFHLVTLLAGTHIFNKGYISLANNVHS
jgi:hypothetical protein